MHLLSPHIALSPVQTFSPLKTRRMRQGLSNSEPQHKTALGVLNINQGCLYSRIFPYTIPVLYILILKS